MCPSVTCSTAYVFPLYCVTFVHICSVTSVILHVPICFISLQALTCDDLQEVLSELVDVIVKWYYIGLQLGLKDKDLSPIRSEYSDHLDCTCEMIKRWLKYSPYPNWKDLADALTSVLVMERNKANQLTPTWWSYSGKTNKKCYYNFQNIFFSRTSNWLYIV